MFDPVWRLARLTCVFPALLSAIAGGVLRADEISELGPAMELPEDRDAPVALSPDNSVLKTSEFPEPAQQALLSPDDEIEEEEENPQEENLFANEIPTTAVAKHKWIDPAGRVVPELWPLVSGWAWRRPSQNVPFRNPILRTWIKIPQGFVIDDIWGTGTRWIKNPAKTPFPESKDPVIAIDIFSPVGTTTFRYQDPRGRAQEASLIIQPILNKPRIWLDKECVQEGFQVVPNRKDKHKFGYLSLVCKKNEKEEHVDLYILHSPDVKTHKSSIKNRRMYASRWAMYRVPKPDRDLEGTRLTLGWIKIGAKGRGKKKPKATAESISDPSFGPGTENEDATLPGNLYAIARVPPYTPARFSGSFGLGISYLGYEESFLLGDKLVEWGLTGKFTAAYQIVYGILDIGGNVFGTLLPLSYNPKTISPSRFYGINGRVGFTLPFSTKALRVRILSGWYFWGMLVPDNAYGVASLNGPQIFLTTTFVMKSGRSTFVYLKFAPVGTNPGFSTNRELAAGAGVQLSSARSRRPLFLTIDLADARFQPQSLDANSLRLLSLTLGVNWNF